MRSEKVYISGALMAAKNLEKAKHLYNYIAEICSENGMRPYLPHNNTDPLKNSAISDIDVFQKDYNEMISSSIVISYIGEPSLGVGAELSICINQNIPIITLNETNNKVSRFLKGMLKTNNLAHFIEYDDLSDLKVKLTRLLNRTVVLR